MPIDVFISYRGADRVLARRLEQRLRSRWGSRVFRDETSLMAGASWSEQLVDAMSQANVMLALIGPGWHVRDSGEDWVKDELLGAIEAGNPVLPVLVGDPDKLKNRLGDLPEAFQRQAVRVSSDLAGFDLHKIEKALRDLGAFGERLPGGLSRQLTDTLPRECLELINDLLHGHSIVVSGPSGSGRAALLRRIAGAVKKQGDLLTTCGIDLGSRSRRTHGAIAAWVDGLCALITEQPPEKRSVLGSNLVNAVLEFGPDLLARQVLRPASLLQLGDDDSDQKILDAARRPTDRWAPFPPERLVSQSLSVIEKFISDSKMPLTLVIDNVESIDGSSKDLLRRLLRAQHKNARLVISTSAVKDIAYPDSAEQCAALALHINKRHFDKFKSISLHNAEIWGKPGALVQQWLKRHSVVLDEDICKNFKNFNPYYALSALWYLVDNGHIVEELKSKSVTPNRATPPDGDLVTWVASRPDEPIVVPGRDRLLDHMIEEFVPVRFRPIIEAGSLMGRRFLFSAAFYAVHPPESIDDIPPTSEAIKRWRIKADEFWDKLEKVDPDGSVIVCHKSADNERMINLAQADLVTHLANQLGNANKLLCHKRLAEYFNNPIADDTSLTPDDKYRNAQAAAAHWASANAPRDAADAEREAAEFAEEALAYPEARGHYKRAIRLFTQLLAHKEYGSAFKLVDHEDLLILASCLYRLGQMTRLSNERKKDKDSSVDPIKYFKHALKRLRELSKNLHDKSVVAPISENHTEYTQRDLPEPNVIRHHIRLCETLRGRVKLELAECYSQSDREESRRQLFDALRHAESARGESDSRGLLAAASAQLAEKLIDDASEALQAGYPVRSHNLAIEAQFHIERVIGLAAVSPDEDRNLEEHRSRAWTVLGQLFQTIEHEQQLASYAFTKMNTHRHEVSDLVDMMTDRRLGLFLLSTHCGDTSRETGEARKLLERHKRWAIESGIAYEHSGAYISLALLELVEQLEQPPTQLKSATLHVYNAIACASDARQTQDAYLLQALLHAIEHADNGGVAHDCALVVESFRQAVLDGISDISSDEDVLKAGWLTLLTRLLRWCPLVEKWVGVEHCLQQPLLNDEAGWARHRFFSSLVKANNGQLQQAFNRSKIYINSHTDEPLVPSSDKKIWRLLESRVPTECYEHACKAKKTARMLLNTFRDLFDGDSEKLTLLGRDLDYAIAVHEWYRSTDPSRLLTLARESNMQIDGHEWASPKLLSGRLAIQVLDHQYGAAKEIGHRRIRQIESMVTNWAKGSRDATPIEQLFYVTLQQHEPTRVRDDIPMRVTNLATRTLDKLYRKSLEERENLVRQAGLGLVQDLHLMDFKPDEINERLDNSQPIVRESDVEQRADSCTETEAV